MIIFLYYNLPLFLIIKSINRLSLYPSLILRYYSFLFKLSLFIKDVLDIIFLLDYDSIKSSIIS